MRRRLAITLVLIASTANAAPKQNGKARAPRARPKIVTPIVAPPAPPAPPPVSAEPPVSSASSAPAPSAPAPAERPSVEPVETRRRTTITLNPLGLAAGRYGANLEHVFLPHHAITATAFVQTFPAWMLRVMMPSSIDVGAGAGSRFGGEIGYRFYSAGDGANGFFLGPSAVMMPLAYPRLTEDLRSEVVSFDAYGGALDLGVQAVTSSGFTIGGGIGVMALAYTPPASAARPPGAAAVSFAEPHVLPRLLFGAGWSF